MTRRRESEPLKKITLNVYERDYERMQLLYPKAGATVAIRQLIHSHVMKVEAKTAAKLDESLVDELEVDVNVDELTE